MPESNLACTLTLFLPKVNEPSYNKMNRYDVELISGEAI